MKCLLSNSPTAAEFLEATKKLYVKTDALIQRKIEPGQPRLFQSTDDEDQIRYKLPSPSAGPFCTPSKRYAFRLVRHSSPSNKSGEQFWRVSTSPPPLHPRSTSITASTQPQVSQGWKPKPKPRLSLMRSMVDLSVKESERPQPKPRRKVFVSVYYPVEHPIAPPISIEPPQQLPHSPLLHNKKSITKPSPNEFTPSLAALKRREHSLQTPSQLPHSSEWLMVRRSKLDTGTQILESSSRRGITNTEMLNALIARSFKDIVSKAVEKLNVMFPVMDESERDFLRAAVQLTYSSDDEDNNSRSPSFGHCSFIYTPGAGEFVEKSCFSQSPTTDSGRPNSDDEDRRTHPCSTKSMDDSFFDSSFHREDEDTPSEALTSISNLRKTMNNFPEEEIRDSHISILEKNARVMRWIHGCASVPVAH